MEIEIRQAGASDIVPSGGARALRASFLDGRRRDGHILCAYVRGQPAGWLVYNQLWGSVPFIEQVQVDEAYRRQGVAAALLGHLETQLRAGGYRFLLGSIRDEESAGLAWLLELGFEECGVLEGLNAGGLGEVFFRKAL
jgi:GNAT superfamily N-acetyltransferase